MHSMTLKVRKSKYTTGHVNDSKQRNIYSITYPRSIYCGIKFVLFNV